MNIRDLARRVNLSKSTVSLALRNDPSISEKTRGVIQRLAKKVGYCPNPAVVKVMSAIACRKLPRLSPSIVLLSPWSHLHEWERPEFALRRFYQGMLSRARQLGYTIEELWMRAPGMSPHRIEQILAARGTEAVIVFNYPLAPASLEVDLGPYACAVIGRALIKPQLYAVDHDHHQGMLLCIEQVRRHGYRRPGLLLDVQGSERNLHCTVAAYQFYLSQVPAKDRIPLWLTLGNDFAKFRKWVRTYRPDVIITSHPRMIAYVNQAGYEVPVDFGLAVLFQESAQSAVAGIDICDEVVAGRAVDLVAEQIRNNQHGPPPLPETTLFNGIWRDGPTLPPAAADRTGGT